MEVEMGTHDPKMFKSRRRRLVFVVVLALVLLSISGWIAVDLRNIRPGMTRDEVVAILGPPDGQMLAIGVTAVDNLALVWKKGQIVVEFDEVHRVREIRRSPSLFDKLRAKIGI